MLHLAASFLLLSSAARGNIGRTLWALCNLIDTLRGLKEVRSNGRRVGVMTRRKLIKQCLIGWIVFVVAEPVALAADMTLFWFPFYKSLKMLITLVVITWRLQASGMIFDNFVVPALRRHEKHIDLTLLLVHLVAALVSFFLISVPWQLVRYVLVGVGLMADIPPAPMPTDTDPSVDYNENPSLQPAPRPLTPRTRSPRRPPSPKPQPSEPKSKAPKATAAKTVSERRRVYETSTEGRTSATSAGEAGTARAALPKRAPASSASVANKRRVPSASQTATAPSVTAPVVKKTTSRATLRAEKKTEERLLALPHPPSILTSDSDSPPPPPDVPVPPPGSRSVLSHPALPVDAPGSSAVAARVARAVPAQPAAKPSNPPKISPRKRPRPRNAVDDSTASEAGRPLKRTARAASKLKAPVTTAPNAAPKAATTTARSCAAAAGKDAASASVASAVPKTKRTRSAVASTTTTSATSRTTTTTAASTKRSRTKWNAQNRMSS